MKNSLGKIRQNEEARRVKEIIEFLYFLPKY